MIYYFDQEDQLAHLLSETTQEIEILHKLPYIYHDKMKSMFFVRFQYLLDIAKIVTLRPKSQSDKDFLRKCFSDIKEIENMAHQKVHTGYDYAQHLNTDSGITLKAFQQIGCDFIYRVKNVILADDVGLGKTIQAVLATCRLVKDGMIKKSIMIVTPASIKYQWKNELTKYSNPITNPEMSDVCIIEGSRANREKCYNTKAKIYIVNYELFLNDFSRLATFVSCIDAIIVDEASKIKTPAAQRTRKMNVLMEKTPIKILLTATPIENKLMDLYSLCRFIDRTLFVSQQLFEKMYCIYTTFQIGRNMIDRNGQKIVDSRTGRFLKTGPWIKQLTGYVNLGNAKLKLAGCYLRRTVEMVGEQMPKFIVQLRTIDLLPEQRKIYDKIKDTPYEFRIAQLHDLHAACNAPEILDPNVLAKSAKITELIDLLENELSSEKVVIFSIYKRFTDIVVQKLKKFSPLYIHGSVPPMERERLKQMFNKMDKYQAMVMTSAGEYGLDFPTASVVINLDLPDNPARLKQRCGRIRRMSSSFKNVRVINIFAKDTIEEKTATRIFKKMGLFERFFEEDNPDLVGGSWYKKMTDSDLKKLF